jgi:hypothetical protein
MLNNVNSTCANYAAEIGVRPEQVRLHVGDRCYRYLKAFTIAPSEDLGATVLDFDGQLVAPAILQGYRDGARGIRAFAAYIAELPAAMPRKEIRLVAEQTNISRSQESQTKSASSI